MILLSGISCLSIDSSACVDRVAPFPNAEIPGMAGSNDIIGQIVVLMPANCFLDNVLAWLYADERPQRFVGADTTPIDQGLQTADSSTWYDGRMIPALDYPARSAQGGTER